MKNTLFAMYVSVVAVSGVAFAQADPNRSQENRPLLEVVFVLDTTGSMSGLLEGAKQKIWSVASRMASGKPAPRIRVGLVAYRDRTDDYVTQRLDLTDDLDKVYQTLSAYRADGGGDGPEHVGRGLGEAVKMMSWSQSARAAKMIFLVGDAPPHDDYNDGWNSRTMAKAAIARGIVVNTIRCGAQRDTEDAFRVIASLADGRFDSIGQSGGMVVVASPFDAELQRLNGALAETGVYAGKAETRTRGEHYKSEQKAMAPSASADRLSFRTNADAKTVGALGGLASADLTAVPQRVLSIPDDELSDELRKMSKAQRLEFVEAQRQQRVQLEAKVTEVTKKRDQWMLKNATPKEDSFDGRVFESVKNRAAAVGVTY